MYMNTQWEPVKHISHKLELELVKQIKRMCCQGAVKSGPAVQKLGSKDLSSTMLLNSDRRWMGQDFTRNVNPHHSASIEQSDKSLYCLSFRHLRYSKGLNQVKVNSVCLWQLLLSVDNLCRQFGTRLGLTECQPDLDLICLTP